MHKLVCSSSNGSGILVAVLPKRIFCTCTQSPIRFGKSWVSFLGLEVSLGVCNNGVSAKLELGFFVFPIFNDIFDDLLEWSTRRMCAPLQKTIKYGGKKIEKILAQVELDFEHHEGLETN